MSEEQTQQKSEAHEKAQETRGPETKLGPAEVAHQEDGSVKVGGEEVDDPDEYKCEPIPGGPTDPDAPELAGEQRKREKQERTADD